MVISFPERIYEAVGNCIKSIVKVKCKAFSKQSMVAFIVYHVTLLVHYVIIFEQAFPYAKVIFFYFLLCPFDRLRDHAVLYHFAFFISHPVHQACNTFAAEHAHKIIFQRNKKAGTSGITLAACTAT